MTVINTNINNQSYPYNITFKSNLIKTAVEKQPQTIADIINKNNTQNENTNNNNSQMKTSNLLTFILGAISLTSIAALVMGSNAMKGCETIIELIKNIQKSALEQFQDMPIQEVVPKPDSMISIKNIKNKTIKELHKVIDEILDEMNSFKEEHPEIINNKASFKQELEYEIIKDKLAIVSLKIQEIKDKILKKFVTRAEDKELSTQISNMNDYLSSEQKASFLTYKDNLTQYNSKLRNVKTEKEISEINNDEVIKNIDSSMNNAQAIPEECTVYRAIGEDISFPESSKFIDSITHGAIIKDPAYVSTSVSAMNSQFLDYAENSFLGKGIIMRIKLPKGTKGLYGDMNEFTLPRNSSFKVNKVEKVDGIKIADVEYILPE